MLSFRTRRAAKGQRGQSTIEFALTAPIFFLVFFGIVNGGTLLFSRNALQHAADVGAIQIGTLGNSSATVDTTNAIPTMEAAGLNNVLLTNVTEILIQKEDSTSSSSSQSLTVDTSGCGQFGVGSGYPCEMEYTRTGGSWPTTPCVAGPTCNWPSNDRNTTQTSGLAGDPDFARLTIYYTFALVGGVATFHMSASVIFRLEPQTL
ncbi:MAG: TadE/TadG family type IV pilus assembly protein [Candidatus Dormiibacterota bacterium]